MTWSRPRAGCPHGCSQLGPGLLVSYYTPRPRAFFLGSGYGGWGEGLRILTIPTTWGTPPYAGGAHFLFLPLPVCQHCHELSAALQKKQNRFQRHYVTDRDMGHCEVCSIRITELVSNEAAASPISRLPLRIPNTWPQAFSKAATR